MPYRTAARRDLPSDAWSGLRWCRRLATAACVAVVPALLSIGMGAELFLAALLLACGTLFLRNQCLCPSCGQLFEGGRAAYGRLRAGKSCASCGVGFGAGIDPLLRRDRHPQGPALFSPAVTWWLKVFLALATLVAFFALLRDVGSAVPAPVDR